MHVTWEPGVTARCFVVRATGEGRAPRTTRPMLRGTGAAPLDVAIFRDDAPAEVMLEALGFADDACLEPTQEHSEPIAASFVKRVAETGLELKVLALPIVPGTDLDGDGVPTPEDCDDGNPLIRPGLVEACDDSFDNDCDGAIDCEDVDCNRGTCAPGRICLTMRCAEGACSNSVDDDGDGLIDCADPDCDLATCGAGSACRTGTCIRGGTSWPYVPSNFDPALVPEADSGIVVDCLDLLLDTQPVPATFTAIGCSPATILPAPGALVQLSFGEAVLFSASSLFIDAGARLTVVGTRPVILAISGDATIAGELLLMARATRAGAGADLNCAGAAGQSVSAGSGAGPGASGGAFGSPGAAGGAGTPDGGTPPNSTSPVGSPSLTPLQGGCSGGVGTGAGGGDRGRAGGGIQVSSTRGLVVSGLIGAPGEGGGGAAVGSFGGGGAGSGGGVLLEAVSLRLTASGRVLALGGGGGEGSSTQAGNPGAPGNRTSGAPAPGGSGGSSRGGAGGAGASQTFPALAGSGGVIQAGGGGGGAGVGRVRFNVTGACSFSAGALVSPQPSSADGGCR